MRRWKREIVAFILNLWLGFGFYFSGTVHGIKWLRFLGLGLAAAILFILPISAVIMHPTPLMNYHFTTSELLLPLAIALTFGIIGVCVEYEIKERIRN